MTPFLGDVQFIGIPLPVSISCIFLYLGFIRNSLVELLFVSYLNILEWVKYRTNFTRDIASKKLVKISNKEFFPKFLMYEKVSKSSCNHVEGYELNYLHVHTMAPLSFDNMNTSDVRKAGNPLYHGRRCVCDDVRVEKLGLEDRQVVKLLT